MIASHSSQKRSWLIALLVGLVLVFGGVIGGLITHRLDVSRAPEMPTRSLSELVLPPGGLVFKSKEGKVVAKIDSDAGGGFFMLYNTMEKPAILLGASEYGGGGIIGLTNGRGVGDMVQIAGTENGARLVLLSTHGKPGLELRTDADGGAVLVKGPTGDAAVTISASDSNERAGKIDVFESISGKTLWTVPAKVK